MNPAYFSGASARPMCSESSMRLKKRRVWTITGSCGICQDGFGQSAVNTMHWEGKPLTWVYPLVYVPGAVYGCVVLVVQSLSNQSVIASRREADVRPRVVWGSQVTRSRAARLARAALPVMLAPTCSRRKQMGGAVTMQYKLPKSLSME